MLNLLWKFFNAIGHIDIVKMGQYGLINTAIWSHCQYYAM